MISYAQNFEDVMLNRVFKGKKDGFYIDVGAWHPVDHSVTKHFYDQGWSGINVEPSSIYWKLLKKSRPRDVNLNCAISDNREAIDYLQIPNSGASTAIASGWKVVANQGKLAKNAIKRKVECLTLEDICKQHGRDKEIDFLKIDVEGAELSVIKGGDWEAYRPRVVIVEAVAPFTNVQNHADWEDILLSKEYVFAYFDGLNRFYVREESKELLAAFSAPPHVFDGFRVYDGSGCIFHKRIKIGRFFFSVGF
jgi:FkbM family methyltransferase